jgi:hypothetical protein
MNDNVVDRFLKMPLPEAGVTFTSNDPELGRLYAKAERLAAANRAQFTPEIPALIEGGGYSRVYTETQPMGGEMYAKRDLRVALNNQLLFMLCQRADGRLPGCVISAHTGGERDWDSDVFMWCVKDWLPWGLISDYEQFQGNALPGPAFKMWWLIGKPDGYLELLANCLEAFDAYLWRTRDPYKEGVLQSWCEWDTGEDNSARFGGSPTRWPHDYPPDGEHTPDPNDPEDQRRYYLWSHVLKQEVKEPVLVPFRSMDIMAYSYENRAIRALISEELGDGKAGYWRAQAEDVRRSFARNLWRPERGAAYDKGRDNKFMETLCHNNLRCMWYGLFDQAMADEFLHRHLLNPEEFFTPVPLPSIAANDPLFRNVPDNNWGGQPQGLTWQRLIRAFENYGFYCELTQFGRIFLKVLRNGGGIFTQQFDPFDLEHPTKDNQKRDGYGPTVLAFLEYLSRFNGVHLERGQIFWSALEDCGDFQYVQRFGSLSYALRRHGATFTASINGVEKFKCSVGVRVVSDLDGMPLQVVGIDTEPRHVFLNVMGRSHDFRVAPNQTRRVS